MFHNIGMIHHDRATQHLIILYFTEHKQDINQNQMSILVIYSDSWLCTHN